MIDPRLDLVTPDGEVVVARAFVASAYATLRQARVGAVFTSQPIHFTREFLAELLEKFLVQELLFERFQHQHYLQLWRPAS